MGAEPFPHDLVAQVCLGLAVAIFVFAGIVMGVRMYRDYQAAYVEGAALTLDAMYVTMPPQFLFYISLVSMFACGGVIVMVGGNVLLAIPFAVAGFFLPRVGLIYLKGKRDALFMEQLVDALMSISNSLRAGFSLPQALELVHREMPNPMSQEIRLVCQELRLGVSVEDALENLRNRMPSADMELVVTAVAIVRDVGGNLTEVFDNIAHTIRERQRIEGKISALTAQGRMQAIVICSLPFVIGTGLYFISPEMFANLTNTPMGWVAMTGILMVMGVAVLVIRKIIRIDV